MRALIVIIVLFTVAYLPSLQFGFLYDDEIFIRSDLSAPLTEQIKSDLLTPYYKDLPYYRPLPAIILDLVHELFGLNSIPFHLINILVGALLVVGVFKLLRSEFWDLDDRACLLGALVVSFHPILSSCVYPISGIESLLATLFGVLAITFNFSASRFSTTSIFLATILALFSRESAIILPVQLGIQLYLTSDRFSRGQIITRGFVVFLATAIYLSLRMVALHGAVRPISISGDPTLIVLSYLYAIQSTLVPPIELNYEPTISVWLNYQSAVAGALLLLLTLLAKRSNSTITPRIRLALALALTSIIPTANILRQETPFDERHLLSFLIFMALTVLLIFKSRFTKIAYMLIVVLSLGVLLPISIHRGNSFESDVAFQTRWNESDPGATTPLNLLAIKSELEGDQERALYLVNRALTIQSTDSLHSELGYLLLEEARIHEAKDSLEKALSINPYYADGHLYLAWVAHLENDPEKARTLFDRASNLDVALCPTINDDPRLPIGARAWIRRTARSELCRKFG